MSKFILQAAVAGALCTGTGFALAGNPAQPTSGAADSNLNCHRSHCKITSEPRSRQVAPTAASPLLVAPTCGSRCQGPAFQPIQVAHTACTHGCGTFAGGEPPVVVDIRRLLLG